jgi:hypothetical protein
VTAQGEDFLAWLERAIAQKEKTASLAAVSLAGSSNGGEWDQRRDEHHGGYMVRRAALRPDATTPPLTDALGERVALALGESEATHIVVNDPASVLRRCAADRKTLTFYTETVAIRDRSAALIQAAQDQGERPNGRVLDDWNRAQREAAILLHPLLNLAEGYGWTEGER